MKKIRLFLVIAMVASASLMGSGCRMQQLPAPPGLPAPSIPVPG